MNGPLFIPLTEAARLLGMSRAWAFELVARGEFPVPVERVGRGWKVSRILLERYAAGELTSTSGAK